MLTIGTVIYSYTKFGLVYAALAWFALQVLGTILHTFVFKLKEAPRLSTLSMEVIQGQVPDQAAGAKPTFVEFWATWCPPCVKVSAM